MNNNEGSAYDSQREGFISTAYWDKSMQFKTVDENGLEVDCYSRVVGEIQEKKNEVNKYYKREKFKNFFVNLVYKFQLHFLLLNIVVTFLTFSLYIFLVGYDKIQLLNQFWCFLGDKLKPSMFAKISEYVNPVINFVSGYGLENLFNHTLIILSITSFIALIIYMIGRDHITIRWFTNLIRIKPICHIKKASDMRLARLQSDLYNIQLRRHEVKFASHE